MYVFDGKPPTLKGGELAKRKDKRDQAEKDLEVARETGDKDAIEKAAKRTVRVSKEQNQEVIMIGTISECLCLKRRAKQRRRVRLCAKLV